MKLKLLRPICSLGALLVAVFTAATATQASSLITAIQQDDLTQVEQEIAEGADVTEEDMFLGSPITLAVIRGNSKIVELLLRHGAPLDGDDYASGTPLHAAAANGHLNIVEILIEHGADVYSARSSNGETPLHAAAEGGNIRVVELLISKGAQVNARSADKYGPIHSAAAAEHFDIVELLLAKGAAPQPIDPVIPLLKAADPVEGARIFGGKCGQCHNVEKNGPNQAGPNLWEIVGRQRAVFSEFDYSTALIRQGGVWTYETLNAFIARPTDFLPGTKMIAMYPAVEDPQERAHIIAYLRQLSDALVALPTHN